MELQINNQTKTYLLSCLTVQDLLNIEKPENQTGIAVAINNKVVSKALWGTQLLQSGDSVLIVTASQGG